jgi:hypothetical protein
VGWTGKLAVSDEEIKSWGVTYPNATNTGLLTKHTPAFDTDIHIPHAADAVEKLVRDRFSEHGAILVRFGNWPKRAIPFRTGDTSFSKFECKLIAPDGTEDKIELLANGQQFIADGIHPDTGKPYSWRDGSSPPDVKHEALPFISQADAYALFNDAVDLLIREHGYRRKPRNGNGEAGGGAQGWQWSEGLGEKKLEEYCDIVRNAKEGGHDAACRGAFLFGRWCGGGLYDVEKALEALKAAARECKAPTKSKSYEAEVERAFLNGVKQPAGPFVKETERANDNGTDDNELYDLGDSRVEDIPPRAWLLGVYLARGFLTVLAAAGGVGKTTWGVLAALSLALSRTLLGYEVKIFDPCTVLYICFEDDLVELRRRFHAAMIHYGISSDAVKGRIFLKAIRNDYVARLNKEGGVEPGNLQERVRRWCDESEAGIGRIRSIRQGSHRPGERQRNDGYGGAVSYRAWRKT